MTELTLTRTSLKAGRYQAVLTSPATPPVIEAVHLEKVIGTAEVSADADRPGHYRIGFDIPGIVMSDGVQVVALRSAADGTVLDRVTILSGAPLDEDIRAEVALLREELEMLKAAFRRHVADGTAG